MADEDKRSGAQRKGSAESEGVRSQERVTINKEFESFDAFIQEYVTNISRSGVFIKTKQPLPVGTIVNLRFSVIMDDVETIAYEILREIRRKRADLPGYIVIVNVHPAVADLLLGPEKAAVADAENRYMRKISVVPRKDYHLEQFDLTGK